MATIAPANENGEGENVYSSICFLAGTMIKTDQGLIAIDKMKPGVHTVDDLKLLCITKTKTEDIFEFSENF